MSLLHSLRAFLNLTRAQAAREVGVLMDPANTPTAGPSNVIVVLLDSLNRHMLGSYGGTEFETPNLDRFSRQRATRFTGHVTGSLPCMPARHDILCGSLDFLWRPWGSIELWEEPITQSCAKRVSRRCWSPITRTCSRLAARTTTVILVDGNTCAGHEGDHWKTYLDPSWIGAPEMAVRPADWFYAKAFGTQIGAINRGVRSLAHLLSRGGGLSRSAHDARGSANGSLKRTPQHDRFMLFVDEFDPHEPFETPPPWRGRYDDQPWDGEAIIWPPYTAAGVSSGNLTEAEGRHIRDNYGSKLSMIDHWFGRLLDAVETRGLWDSTAIIVCTDHGHYLGEVRDGNDIWGKPMVPQFEPLGHTPLLIHWPGSPGGGTCSALTTNVDLYATLADIFQVSPGAQAHGVSLVLCSTGRRRLSATGLSAACGATGCRSPTGGTNTRALRERQLSVVDVVKSLVDDAAPGRLDDGPADSGQAGHAGLHAGLGDPRDSSTLRTWRRAADVGQRCSKRWPAPPVRPRRRSRRAAESVRRTRRTASPRDAPQRTRRAARTG